MMGRPEDVSVNKPADIGDLFLTPEDLPSAFMNDVIVLEILKPVLTSQA